MDVSSLGKLLANAGIAAVVAGVVLILGPRIPWLGCIPGDLVIRREGFTLFFPLASMIIVSVLLTIVINLFFRLFK